MIIVLLRNTVRTHEGPPTAGCPLCPGDRPEVSVWAGALGDSAALQGFTSGFLSPATELISLVGISCPRALPFPVFLLFH